MESDVATSPLEEIAELTGGYAFKSGDYSDEGRFILRTLNIKDDASIVRDDAVFLPLEKCAEYERFELQEHDTLFVMVGATLGKVGYVRAEILPALLNQNMWRIRGREGRCDKRYLQYAFRHVVSKSLGWASGSARDFVRRDDYRKLPIPTPPLPEQKAIARILGTLDDKIELNRRMNATLEAMARALFQSWFIDFDPVRRNAARAQNQPSTRPNGHPSPSGRRDGDERADDNLPLTMGEGWGEGLVDLDKLFPDSFQSSALGEIPNGWAVEPLSRHLNVIKGRSYKSSELAESKTALVTLKSFQRGGGYRPDGLKAYTGDYKPDQRISPGDLVLAYTDVTQAADIIGKPAIVRSDATYETLVASLDVGIVRPISERASIPFLYCLFLTERFQAHTYAHATGTTVLHLSSKAVPSYEFCVPSQPIAEAFAKLAAPLFQLIDRNDQQSRTLATLRDTLLPKLLGGELSLSALQCLEL